MFLIIAHLARHSSPQEDGESECGVHLFHQLTQLLGTLQFILFEPFLNKLLLALSQYGPAELQGLVFVELAAFEENAKVL